MLPKQNRLKTKHLTQEFFSSSKRTHTPHFLIFSKPSQAGLLFAVSISKKTLKSAVDRNRQKRLIIQQASTILSQDTPLQILITVKKPIEAKALKAELVKNLTTIQKQHNS